MAARRAVQAKTLASQANLSSSQHSLAAASARSNARLKSTSMTNLNQQQLVAGSQQGNNKTGSRSALDSIHKGMNAKFTHVQSKVLLQNIRPQAPASSSRLPATPARLTAARRAAPTSMGKASSGQQSDRSQLINRIKTLQEEAERQAEARDELRAELERERQDKHDQLAQAKLELQEKAAESERQSEDYHRKLLEAYELADQNRRAADSVLSESRAREDELRKRIEELEAQLLELKEFVSQKEELVGKMGELRDQIAHERERYEEKTRTLNQLFEKEKISEHMRVDQKSNYFRRAKGSLQSSDSINQLADSTLVMAVNQQHQQQQQSYARSEHDMVYGSKLSTRMQDGARSAWKKSRKFASSLVTGSLGGLSACRRHQMGGSRGPVAKRTTQGTTSETFVQQQECSAVTQQPEQHTSVVEVGVTVGEFMQQQQQQQALSSGELQVDQQQQQQQQQLQLQAEEQKQSLIRVDENNKLTIVTKFNDAVNMSTQSSADCPASSAVSSAASSEGGRCESSSSGRGTASTCDSSSDSATGSQNGDAVELTTTGRTKSDSADSADFHQRHKRTSSLAFKENSATFKSFFVADRKSSDAAVAQSTVASYDEQSVPRLSTFAKSTTTSADLDANGNETRVIELAH